MAAVPANLVCSTIIPTARRILAVNTLGVIYITELMTPSINRDEGDFWRWQRIFAEYSRYL